MILEQSIKPYACVLLKNYILNIVYMVLKIGIINKNYENYLISSQYEVVNFNNNEYVAETLVDKIISDTIRKIENKNQTHDDKENINEEIINEDNTYKVNINKENKINKSAFFNLMNYLF